MKVWVLYGCGIWGTHAVFKWGKIDAEWRRYSRAGTGASPVIKMQITLASMLKR